MTSKRTSMTFAAPEAPPVVGSPRAGLLRARLAPCGVHTTLASSPGTVIRTLLLALALCPAHAIATARAQGAPPTPVPAPTPTPAPATPTVIEPGAGAALAWCAQVRGAIEAWSVDDLRAGARPMHGASVVLRLNGRVIGRATQLGAPGRTIDPVSVVQAALDEAASRAPIEAGDPERPAKLRAMGLSAQISAEIAGPIVPLLAGTMADVDAEVAVGLEGVGAGFAPGFGDQEAERTGRVSAVFPSFMVASNISPSEALRQCVARLTEQPALGLIEPAELRQKHGLRFYRFRVAHAAEPGGGVGATLLYRGQRLVEQSSIDERAELKVFAITLADHLARRVPEVEHQITEMVEIDHAGRHSGLPRPMAVAATAVALHRYDPMGKDWNQAVDGRVLTALPAFERAARAWDRGQDDAPVETPLASLLLRAADFAPFQRMPQGVFEPEKGFAASIPPAARGIVAWALRDPRAVREAYIGHSPGSLVNLMPWLGYAELSVLERGATTVPAAPILRQHRELIWQHQLSAVDAGADGADLVGGIIFPGARVPLPTWQTARAVCFLAAMLRDERLTTRDERAREIARLLGAMRFLRQLQVDRTLTWHTAHPEAALGGVRASTFDQSLPAEATALTLLATLELIESVDQLTRESAPKLLGPGQPRAPRSAPPLAPESAPPMPAPKP